MVNEYLPSDLEKLSSWLKYYDAWPEAGDEFVKMILQTHWSAPKPTEQDYEWLPTIIKDVFGGADIGARYPSFFQKLLSHSSLRQRFIAELQNRCNHTPNGKTGIPYKNGHTG